MLQPPSFTSALPYSFDRSSLDRQYKVNPGVGEGGLGVGPGWGGLGPGDGCFLQQHSQQQLLSSWSHAPLVLVQEQSQVHDPRDPSHFFVEFKSNVELASRRERRAFVIFGDDTSALPAQICTLVISAVAITIIHIDIPFKFLRHAGNIALGSPKYARL